MADSCLNFVEKYGLFILSFKKKSGLTKINKEPVWPSLLYLLMAAVLLIPGPGQASIASSPGDDLGLVQVMSPKESIKIYQVKGLTLKAGDSLPLFQENEKYFIALAEDKYGEPTLAAFARKNYKNQATAWVTAQKSLVFAIETSARSGKMYLRKGENLQVLQEHRKTYEVIISRYGKNHRMEISKKLSGIHYRPGAELPPELRPEKTRVTKITLADLPPTKRAQPPAVSKEEDQKPASALLDKSALFLTRAISKAALLFEKDPQEIADGQTDTTSEAQVDRTVYYRPKDAYQEPNAHAETKFVTHVVDTLQEQSTLINIFLTTLIIIVLLFARKTQSPLQNQAAPSPHEPPEMTKALETPPSAPKEAQIKSSQPPAFTGSLEVFNIKNLVQFLHNSSSTGVLNLEVEDTADPGRVILDMGEVKHATFNGAVGHAAFQDIFGLHRGSFRFQLSQQIKTEETIHTETSQLIDETAKLVALRNEQKIINFNQAG